MTDKQKNESTAGAVAAGVMVGAAATVAAVALSNKDNREKLGKAIDDAKKKGAEIKKLAAEKLDAVRENITQREMDLSKSHGKKEEQKVTPTGPGG
jgi:hypothetical protein